MRKILLLLGAALFLVPLAAAQFTIVTGTVKDVNGIAYAGGTISASLVVPGGTSPTLNGVGFTGSMSPIGLDSTGSFTARLADNNVVLPSGTQWKFLVNNTGASPPLGTGPQTCTATLTITGASQSVSASFAACPALSNSSGGGISPVTSVPATCTGTTAISFQGIIYDCINGTYAQRVSPLSGGNSSGIWQKMGTIIYADPSAGGTDQGNSSEASVICEASPQVLTAGLPTVCGPPGTAVTANAVLKMWFHCGYSTENLCYAEALASDPRAWFRRAGAPLVLNHAHGRVFKNGSTYHYYATNGALTQTDHYTSSDGIVFTLSQAAVLTVGTAGAWDATALANNRVWIEGATWFMLYEAKGAGTCAGGQWCTGIATSTDGAGNTWTKNATAGATPLCTGCGGPDKYKDAVGNYWVWTHSAPAGSSIPSDIFRWTSANLNGVSPTLTASPAPSVLPRTSFDEGMQSATGQVADISHIEVNGTTMAFYEGGYDGNTLSAYLHMKVAISNLPWAAIVQTNEGVAPSQRSWDSSFGLSIGNPGIPPPPGGLIICNSLKTNYPCFAFQNFTLPSGTDVNAIGYNQITQTGNGSSPGANQRTLTTLTAARRFCNVSTINANASCGVGMTNAAGTEGLPWFANFDANGNVFDTLPAYLTTETTKPPIAASGSQLYFPDSVTHTPSWDNNNNGTSSPTGAWQCTNVTPVTVNANVATDQNLMTCSVPAGTLNRVGRTLRIWLAGVYSTPAASTTAVVIKAKLGALTLATWTSTALAGIQATNDQFNVTGWSTTQTAGATAAFEVHGNMDIDLGVGNTIADSNFADVNTATVSSVDSTATQTLQITIAFTVASGSNTATQRQLILETVN